MSELTFSVIDIAPEPYAVTPTLTAKVHLEEASGVTVHAMALRCQVRIDPQRRQYSDSEAHGLADLFGERHRWNATLRPFLWMHTSAMVRGFHGGIDIDLPLACTYDFEVSAAKYLHAVRDGEIPLSLLFSGTVFTRGVTDFQIEQIPWHSDVDYRMPAAVWHQAMDLFFPNAAWIRVPRTTLDALQQFKSDRGLPTWEEAFDAMLDSSGGRRDSGVSLTTADLRPPGFGREVAREP